MKRISNEWWVAIAVTLIFFLTAYAYNHQEWMHVKCEGGVPHTWTRWSAGAADTNNPSYRTQTRTCEKCGLEEVRFYQ